MMDRAMTPENSVARNSTEDAKLNAALEALEAARELQKLRRSHGVDRIHLLVEDVDGDWLEEWGEDEVLDSEDFQDRLGYLAALARKEELKKEFQKREEEIDQEIQYFRAKRNQQLQRACPPPLLFGNIDRIRVITLSAEDYFSLGNDRFWERRYEEAIAAYNESLRLTPNNLAEVLCNKGAALAQIQRYEEALLVLDEVIKVEPDFPGAWYNRGAVFSQRYQYEEAVAAYNEALKYKSDFFDAWINRGDSLDELGQYKEAVESYDKALKLKLDDFIAWYNRGILLGKLGRYKEAIESYDKALKLKSDFPEAWINRGYALNKLGCYKESIASCEEALKYNPDHPQAWFNIACSQSQLGEIDQAIASLQKAIEINPKFREQAKTDSDFDAIRQDDRFQQLLANNGES
jgi:tetratricopeptide (TPR) repeat protein